MTPPLSGVLVAAKPAGVTSFDVVAAVRRALAVRRVGHAGTLDPDATGVLPILIGEATKLMPYLADQDKEYRVTVRLGVTTDTLDAGGRVLSERPVPDLDRAAVERTARRFVGRITQVPPMFSAVHHGGRRLYELAREGREVERTSREVIVHAIDVRAVSGTTAELTVVCGKGTYVRALVADLGEALGCGAIVEGLVRTRVGGFRLADAVPWDEIAGPARPGLRDRVRPAEAALGDWAAVTLDAAAARAFVHGQAVPVPAPACPSPGPLRVHDADGRLLGVGEAGAGGSRVRPVRILHVDRPGTRVVP
jgi:tRNA pseudouridine55 synthase